MNSAASDLKAQAATFFDVVGATGADPYVNRGP